MRAATLLSIAFFVVSCGGGKASAPPPEAPPTSGDPAATDIAEPPPTASSAAAGAPSAPAADVGPPPSFLAPTPAKVEFPAHATVEQAIKAVPQGAPRLNMSNDLLQGPLLDLKRYDKCKVPRSVKVSMSAAVYDGAAVGVDVTTKPKNGKLEECIDGVVRSITWEKVPSLNQVNVNF